MSYSMFGQLSEGVEYLIQALHSVLFVEAANRLQVRGQIAVLRQFKDDVKIIRGFVNIIAFNDVGTLQHFVELDLLVESFSSILVLHDFILV